MHPTDSLTKFAPYAPEHILAYIDGDEQQQEPKESERTEVRPSDIIIDKIQEVTARIVRQNENMVGRG